MPRKPNPYHASEPTAWLSPRHDWYRVSHSIHYSNAAGPAHAPAAPIACALASTAKYHASSRPPPRARLIRRRPRHLHHIHWPPACCTSPATAPLRRRLCADERGEGPNTSAAQTTIGSPANTHLPALFCPAEGLASVAPPSRPAARRCETARVTWYRGQGSGRLRRPRLLPLLGSLFYSRAVGLPYRDIDLRDTAASLRVCRPPRCLQCRTSSLWIVLLILRHRPKEALICRPTPRMARLLQDLA